MLKRISDTIFLACLLMVLFGCQRQPTASPAPPAPSPTPRPSVTPDPALLDDGLDAALEELDAVE